MSDDYISVSLHEGVATLTLNDPATRNALSPALIGQFGQQLKTLAAPTSGVRCLVIAGSGKTFCSGANLKGLATAEERARMAGTPLQHVFHPLLRRIREFPAPVVASVNGGAVGGGMSLALMADLVIAARSAFFLQAFRNIGLVPDCGSSWLLARLVGLARAREMSLLGERLSAKRALKWGLINRVTEDDELQEVTASIADRIASGPLEAQTLTRKLYWASPHNSFEEQIDLEDRMQERANASAEAREGIAAFREKRAPDFRRIMPGAPAPVASLVD